MIESENNRKGKLLAKKELLTKLNFCLGLCLVINLFFWWHLCSWSVALDDGSSPLTFIRELDRALSLTSRPQIPPGGHHMHGPLCRNCTTGQRLASVAGVQGSLPDCPWSSAVSNLHPAECRHLGLIILEAEENIRRVLVLLISGVFSWTCLHLPRARVRRDWNLNKLVDVEKSPS